MRLLRSHGMTSTTWDRHHGHAADYDVVAAGWNFRPQEISAPCWLPGPVRAGRAQRAATRGIPVGTTMPLPPATSAGRSHWLTPSTPLHRPAGASRWRCCPPADAMPYAMRYGPKASSRRSTTHRSTGSPCSPTSLAVGVTSHRGRERTSRHVADASPAHRGRGARGSQVVVGAA